MSERQISRLHNTEHSIWHAILKGGAIAGLFGVPIAFCARRLARL